MSMLPVAFSARNFRVFFLYWIYAQMFKNQLMFAISPYQYENTFTTNLWILFGYSSDFHSQFATVVVTEVLPTGWLSAAARIPVRNRQEVDSLRFHSNRLKG